MISEKNRFDRTILWGLIVLEALLFSSFYLREVAWYPPDNFDQASYLIETYQLQGTRFRAWSRSALARVLEPGTCRRGAFPD
jgi:hypothetical protein